MFERIKLNWNLQCFHDEAKKYLYFESNSMPYQKAHQLRDRAIGRIPKIKVLSDKIKIEPNVREKLNRGIEEVVHEMESTFNTVFYEDIYQLYNNLYSIIPNPDPKGPVTQIVNKTRTVNEKILQIYQTAKENIRSDKEKLKPYLKNPATPRHLKATISQYLANNITQERALSDLDDYHKRAIAHFEMQEKLM